MTTSLDTSMDLDFCPPPPLPSSSSPLTSCSPSEPSVSISTEDDDDSFILPPSNSPKIEVNNNERLKSVVDIPEASSSSSSSNDEDESHEDSAAVERIVAEEIKASVYELDSRVRIVVKEKEEWLCVARLPVDFSEEELRDMLGEYGTVDELVLVNHKETGKSQVDMHFSWLR